MGKKSERTKQKIIQAANRLFYRRGYNNTSLSEIVEASGVPRGNIYYYYPSKEAILRTVIEMRLHTIDKMLSEWDQQYDTPGGRLKSIARVNAAIAEATATYGCPIGSLNAELGKQQLDLQEQAIKLFQRFLDYFRQQFEAMGYAPVRARKLALQLMVRVQGISMMTHVLHEPKVLLEAQDELNHWIDQMTPNQLSQYSFDDTP